MNSLTFKDESNLIHKEKFMPIDTSTATRESLKKASTAELIALHDKLSGKPIKKFENRSIAEARVWKLIGTLSPEENFTVSEAVVGSIPDVKITEKSIESKPKKTAAAKKTAPESKRADYENRLIEVTIKVNPKREGSRAHKKFGLLMEMAGKTVGEYRSKEGKYPTLDIEKGWAATEIRWALKQGWIKLVKKAKEDVAA